MALYIIIAIMGTIMLIAGVMILGYALIVYALGILSKYDNGKNATEEKEKGD